MATGKRVASDAAGSVFDLGVGGLSNSLDGISFSGREAMSDLYRYDAIVAYPSDDAALLALESTMLGRPAYLRIAVPDKPDRYVHGVVAGFCLDGPTDRKERARLRITLTPRMWLLTMRKHSRVFQDLTVQQVVVRVLDEWGIGYSWRLGHTLPPRR